MPLADPPRHAGGARAPSGLKEEDSGQLRALEPSTPCFSRLSARSALYSDLPVTGDRRQLRSAQTGRGAAGDPAKSYRARVEAELRRLATPPPDPDEQVFELRPLDDLTGRRFATEQKVDEAFAQETTKLQRSAEDLKARIREGCTVVVK